MSAPVQIGTTRLAAGWHEGLGMDTYLSDPAVSASRLWSLHQTTPAHLRAELAAGVGDRSTKAKELGSIAHVAVFEPDELEARYIVLGKCAATKKGDGQPCTNQGAVWRDGQAYCRTKGHDPHGDAPEAPGIYTVEQPILDCAGRMKAALHAHPTARALLAAPGPREVTGIVRDPVTGLWLRIRPDELVPESPAVLQAFHQSVVNLKTTGKPASPAAFVREAERLGVYFKAAFYRLVAQELGFEPQHFYYPVVESFGSHEVIVYRLHEDALDVGEAEVRQALGTLTHCVKTGDWPGYGPAVHDLNLSDWRLKQIHDLDFLEVA